MPSNFTDYFVDTTGTNIEAPGTGANPVTTNVATSNTNTASTNTGTNNNANPNTGNTYSTSWNPTAYKNQMGKLAGLKAGTVARFSMTLGKYTFQASLDPNDINLQQSKRYAMLDVLGGVIVQDFGWKPSVLEIKGTTGSKYYDAIAQMNLVYNAQGNGNPVPVQVTLEGQSYQAVLQQFNYGRQINPTGGNLVNYQMSFTVLSQNAVPTSATDSTVTTAAVPQAMAANSTSTVGGQALQSVTVTNSINGYLQSASSTTRTNYIAAVAFLRMYWPNGSTFPPNLNQVATYTFNIPSPNWTALPTTVA